MAGTVAPSRDGQAITCMLCSVRRRASVNRASAIQTNSLIFHDATRLMHGTACSRRSSCEAQRRQSLRIANHVHGFCPSTEIAIQATTHGVGNILNTVSQKGFRDNASSTSKQLRNSRSPHPFSVLASFASAFVSSFTPYCCGVSWRVVACESQFVHVYT